MRGFFVAETLRRRGKGRAVTRLGPSRSDVSAPPRRSAAANEVVLVLRRRQAQRIEPVFQMVRQVRRADQVIGAGRRRLLIGGALGLLDFLGLETAAPDPHDRDEAGLLLLAQPVDEGAQLAL